LYITHFEGHRRVIINFGVVITHFEGGNSRQLGRERFFKCSTGQQQRLNHGLC
jgi:hypothetical protein